jgi:hypothetical protein
MSWTAMTDRHSVALDGDWRSELDRASRHGRSEAFSSRLAWPASGGSDRLRQVGLQLREWPWQIAAFATSFVDRQRQ